MTVGRLWQKRWRGAAGLLSLLAVFAAACGSGDEGATPSTNMSAIAADTTDATTTTTTTTTTATTETCREEQRSGLSDDWEYVKFTDLFSSDFLFFVPLGWVDQPPTSFPAADAFHPDNLSETGLDPNATVQPIAVTHPSQLPGVSLLTLTGVTSSLDVVYARQEDHIRAGTGTDVKEILRTGLRSCLGGQPAMGLELLLDGDIYSQVWTTVRSGTLYQIVLVAEDEAQADVLDEISRGWAWDEAAVEAAAAADAKAAMAAGDTSGTPGVCEEDPPTTTSEGWSQLHADDFSFSHPGDWQDLSGVVTVSAAGLLDEDTYAETGLAADATFTYTLVRGPGGFPNVSVFEFDGVESPLDEVHPRLADHLGSLAEVQAVTSSQLPLCVGGESAAALELEYAPADSEVLYQENWYVIRLGKLYQIQLLAEGAETADIFHELLRTWDWQATDEPATRGDASGGVFVEAHTATDVDTSLDAPDPTTFTSVFGSDTTEVHVVYRLRSGTTGRVQVVWKREGEVILEAGTHYSDNTNWASFSIAYSGGEILDPGDYEVELEMEKTGDRVVVPFMVEEN